MVMGIDFGNGKDRAVTTTMRLTNGVWEVVNG